jgi:hypothetical protein
VSERLVPLFGLVTLLVCSGCYTLRADLPGALRHDVAADVEVIGRVDVETSHTYFVGGLLRDAPRGLFKQALLDAVTEAGGDGVANLVFDTRFSAADVVINTVTLGVVSPRTYRLRGDIVRIRRAALPGRPLLQRPTPEKTARPAEAGGDR